MSPPIARILTIAGSDSGGGAGIQADIKTITMLGGHALTAITAVTAQNTLGVDAIELLSPELVIAQIDAVARDIGVDAVKIGMLGSADIARAIAERLDPSIPRHADAPAVKVVLDPVMIASSGAHLADAATIEGLEALMRRATLITPNLPELERLTGRSVTDAESLGDAAHALARRLNRAVLAKGGHLEGNKVVDVLVRGGRDQGLMWTDDRIETVHTHGTGCTLSSAIATLLAQGHGLESAIATGRLYVRAAMRAAPELGKGHGPMGLGIKLPPWRASPEFITPRRAC